MGARTMCHGKDGRAVAGAGPQGNTKCVGSARERVPFVSIRRPFPAVTSSRIRRAVLPEPPERDDAFCSLLPSLGRLFLLYVFFVFVLGASLFF